MKITSLSVISQISSAEASRDNKMYSLSNFSLDSSFVFDLEMSRHYFAERRGAQFVAIIFSDGSGVFII